MRFCTVMDVMEYARQHLLRHVHQCYILLQAFESRDQGTAMFIIRSPSANSCGYHGVET